MYIIIYITYIIIEQIYNNSKYGTKILKFHNIFLLEHTFQFQVIPLKPILLCTYKIVSPDFIINNISVLIDIFLYYNLSD